MVKKKNAAAVALGRRGAKARLTKLTPEKRSDVARTAATARWKNKVPVIDGKPASEPLAPAQSSKLAAKAATDPKWKNKTTGAKKI